MSGHVPAREADLIDPPVSAPLSAAGNSVVPAAYKWSSDQPGKPAGGRRRADPAASRPPLVARAGRGLRMSVHFELTEPDESMIATGNDFAHAADLVRSDNHSSVIRPPRDSGLAARHGQRLTTWIEERMSRRDDP